jgi:hypothetical protein
VRKRQVVGSGLVRSRHGLVLPMPALVNGSEYKQCCPTRSDLDAESYADLRKRFDGVAAKPKSGTTPKDEVSFVVAIFEALELLSNEQHRAKC